ncbi:hypothetical protein QF000_000361 [Paraburkholderia atlantica]
MLRPHHERPTEENAPHEGTRDQLLKENEHLRAGVGYLKKSRPVFRRRNGRRKRKTQIVLQLRRHHRLPALLEAAELARSTFYYQSKATGILLCGSRQCGLHYAVQLDFRGSAPAPPIAFQIASHRSFSGGRHQLRGALLC